MKKLLIIMTLFMSSFFLFSLEDVKAYSFKKELDFSLIDDINSLKDLLDTYIENDITYSDYYIIYYDGQIKYYLFLDFSIDNFAHSVTYNSYRYQYKGSLKSGTNLSYIYLSGSTSNAYFYFYSTANNGMILYQNFDLYLTSDLSSSITYTYNDFEVTYNLISGTKVMTLYDIYEEYNSFIGNEEGIHKEELSKIESFYSVVIEKLGYLGEILVSNYIYLSVIVIFILIFVFKLIFRRFLW